MSPKVTAEIARLPDFTVNQLVERYTQVFGEECRSRNKQYLVRRIAWRLQANDEGGLSPAAIAQAKKLADDAAGKSLVLAKIASDAVQQWNGRVLILAHVKELLEQNADKVRRLCPDIKVGMYSAGLKKRDTNTPVLVAGIQSIYKRACELDSFDLIVVDEAHLISKTGDGMYRQFLADCKVINPHVRVIGLTATPFRLDSGMICSAEHFLNHVCYEIGIKELIRDGYLSPLISKAGVNRADFGNLHVRAGEFVSEEVESLVNDDALVSAACAEIVELTADRRAVLIFASSVAHGLRVVEVLRKIHDIECGFVTGETPIHERDELLSRFRGDAPTPLIKTEPLRFLCNVNVLTTGFDAPRVDCVVMLRPTMSPGLLYQTRRGRGRTTLFASRLHDRPRSLAERVYLHRTLWLRATQSRSMVA